MTERIVQRRTVLALTAGGAGALLTGCVVQAQPQTAAPAQPAQQPAQPAQPTRAAQSAQPSTAAPPKQPAQNALARLDDVPAGGGVVLADQKLVLTRNDAGKAFAFSAVCTHQGCIVAEVRGGTINCACHGSTFDASTGQVVNGPARQPLPPVSVQQRDGAIFRA
jgi:Rieske Fe-S protein